MSSFLVNNAAPVDASTFRWSFSQWEAYDTCPLMWKFKRDKSIPRRPPGPAAARGLDMHDRAEKYIKGEIDLSTAMYGDPEMRFGDKKPAKIHEDYIPILDAYREHQNGDRHTEKKMAMDSEWFLCGPSTQHACCIAVLDACKFTVQPDGYKILDIAEWKSGFPKERHADQRKLYSAFGLKGWLADEVRTTTYYLEGTAKPQRLVVKASAWDTLVNLWSDRRNRMINDNITAARPGDHCNWCDFAARKGGPCQFGR
jgi:hypothetical protein